jgi:hypothetical protein
MIQDDHFMDGLTPYQLSQIRDALGQAGSDQGVMSLGGLRLGGVEMQLGAGDMALSGIVRRSTAIGAGVTRNTPQSIPYGTWTPVSWLLSEWDTDAMFNLAGAPTRLTVNTGGVYSITGCVRWYANDAGERWLEIRVNGAIAICQVLYNVAGIDMEASQCVAMIYDFIQGDYVQLYVWQGSGAALDVDLSAGPPSWRPRLSMARVV